MTAHWRKFISPLMWRCQWSELRMKQLFSQASMYDKELMMYRHEKELQSKIIELDSSVSRSVPFPSRNNWKRSMDRRKRKRTEDKDQISSYLSNHVIFSYYGSYESHIPIFMPILVQHLVIYATVVQRIREQIQMATQLMMIAVKVKFSANSQDFFLWLKINVVIWWYMVKIC